MQGLRRWLAATLVVSISGVWQLPIALADERTDARREFRAGMQAIADGRYDEGIAHLESAYDTLPHPNVLYNIGLAHMYAGRADEAISYFERYKETAPPSDAAEIDVLIGNLRGKSEAVAAAETAAQEAAQKGDVAGAIEAAAREVRRMAEETGNEALKRQAEGLEATAKTMRGEKPAETTAETTVAKPEAPKPSEVAAEQKQEGVYEEEVVSASRFAQSPLDAPNATAIITAQDIRMTGMLTLTDILRRVVGMEVTSVTPNHAEVSIRGLNKRQSNKVLFLIDGRSHRLDFLGTSWINQQPVALEDIERIEIIKGPASALYGADAFSGIINVITRAPGEGRSFIAGQYGSNNVGRGVMSFTGRNGKIAYRMSTNYVQSDNAVVPVGPDRIDVEPLTDTPNVARKGAAVDGQLRFDLAKDTQLTLGGNALYGDNTVQGQSRLGQVTSFDAWESNVYETLTLPYGFKIAGWYDHISGNSGPSYLTPGAVELIGTGLKQDIADADVSWSGRFKLLVPQNFTVGGGYRFKAIKWAWIDGNHTQNHFGAYIQDVLELAKPLTLQIGARVDHHPLLSSVQFSPRGSLVYRFLEQQSLRLSIGRAFRGPSFLESYVQVPNSSTLRGVEGYGKGNDGLAPESIVSYELGYQNQASDYFALEANVYFNTVKDLILFTDIDRYPLQQYGQSGRLAAYDPAQEAFAATQIAYVNETANYRQLGAEVGVRIYPVAGLDIYGNYSIHDTSPFDDSKVDDPVRLKEQQTSLHKVNAGIQWRARFGLDLAADVAWTSSQVWVEQVTDETRGVRFQAFDVQPLTWVNARIGYRLFNDQLELGVVGTNLAFQDKRQHPYGQPLDTRVFGSAKLRF
jgi:outer membrane receptor for ferrienterochelin and colicin